MGRRHGQAPRILTRSGAYGNDVVDDVVDVVFRDEAEGDVDDRDGSAGGADGGTPAREVRKVDLGGFAILAMGGGAIVWARYGGMAALTVILGGAGIVALLWLLLSLMEAWARAD